MTSDAPIAVVLLSGGLDSATTLAVARQDFSCVAVSFDYGQRHRFELDAARRVAAASRIEDHRVLSIDVSAFRGSALTDDIDVPKDRDEAEMADIPVTYVPARNLVMLSMALAIAESIGSTDLFVGVNAVDYSGYPDCRPEFIRSFEETAGLATRAGTEGGRFRVHAPLIDLRKDEIIRLGHDLGVDYALTHSCYDPGVDGHACGRCDSCVLRRRGFEQAGIDDPTVYE